MSPAQLCLIVLLAFVGAAMLGPAARMRSLTRDDPTPMRRAALSLAVVPGFCVAAIPLLELGRPSCDELQGQLCRTIDPGVALVMFGGGAFFVALGLLYLPRAARTTVPDPTAAAAPSKVHGAQHDDTLAKATQRGSESPTSADHPAETATAAAESSTEPLPVIRIDGREASLSDTLESMAVRLVEGDRVVLVSSGEVDDRVHHALEMLADELQATRSVVGGSDSAAHRLAGASALHEDALALALAGGAFDVVLFVDTLVGGEFNVERIRGLESLALTSGRNEFVDAARVALLCSTEDHHTVSLALLREVQSLRVRRARRAERVDQPMIRLSDMSIEAPPTVASHGVAVSLSAGPALLSVPLRTTPTTGLSEGSLAAPSAAADPTGADEKASASSDASAGRSMDEPSMSDPSMSEPSMSEPSMAESSMAESSTAAVTASEVPSEHAPDGDAGDSTDAPQSGAPAPAAARSDTSPQVTSSMGDDRIASPQVADAASDAAPASELEAATSSAPNSKIVDEATDAASTQPSDAPSPES